MLTEDLCTDFPKKMIYTLKDEYENIIEVKLTLLYDKHFMNWYNYKKQQGYTYLKEKEDI